MTADSRPDTEQQEVLAFAERWKDQSASDPNPQGLYGRLARYILAQRPSIEPKKEQEPIAWRWKDKFEDIHGLGRWYHASDAPLHQDAVKIEPLYGYPWDFTPPSHVAATVTGQEADHRALTRQARALLFRAWAKSGEGALGGLSSLITAIDHYLQGTTQPSAIAPTHDELIRNARSWATASPDEQPGSGAFLAAQFFAKEILRLNAPMDGTPKEPR